MVRAPKLPPTSSIVFVGIKSKLDSCVLFGNGCVHDILSDRVSGHDDFVGGEEALHAFVSHADLAGLLCQQLVSDAGIAVLLLNETWDTHAGAYVQRRSAGVTTHSDSHHRLEVFDNFLCHPLALPNLEEHCDVFQKMLTVETADGQAFDVVACRGNPLHLHASQSTHELDFGTGIFGFDGIGDRDCREDMASCASAADDDS